jgi:hypothetical protein
MSDYYTVGGRYYRIREHDNLTRSGISEEPVIPVDGDPIIETLIFLGCECPDCVPGNPLSPAKCWFERTDRFPDEERRVHIFQRCSHARYDVLNWSDLLKAIQRRSGGSGGTP